MKQVMGKVQTMKKKTKILLVVGLITLLAVAGWLLFPRDRVVPTMGSTEHTVAKTDITSSITGTATIQPRDQYTINSLVSGEVMAANFEEGDVVEEGQLLFRIDSSDIEKNLRSADISLQQAQNSYTDVQKNLKNLTVISDVSGKISTLYVKKGDTVGSGGKIATVYDDSEMDLTLPFNEQDATQIATGSLATVYLTDVGEPRTGTVLSVGTASYVKTGNRLVRDVKIRVQNPGTITPSSTATAVVGSFACNDSGTFAYKTEKTILAKTAGEVASIQLEQGNFVTAGQRIVTLESDSLETSVRNSELSLENSRIQYEKAMDNLENYTITAPISGTVVSKNVKQGDKLDTTNMSTGLAVIYDLSSLKFDINVDELDIHRISAGQEVHVTADALDGKEYVGHITNVSINGSSSGGVTTYPVTVEIAQFDEDLLPGMNVDVEIVVEQVKQVLAVPVSAVMRGNQVYVKGEKTDENDKAPEGYRSVKVVTGIYNDAMIEITSGLSEGDIVYAPMVESNSFMDMMGMMGGMHGGMAGGGPSSGGPGGGAPGGGEMNGSPR